MTYVFDIDGTICTSKDSDYSKAIPIKERIEKINKLYEEGNIINFNTARGMGRTNNCATKANEMFRDLTTKQLKEWGVKYHKLFLGKPAGDLYIDDKGVKDGEFFND